MLARNLLGDGPMTRTLSASALLFALGALGSACSSNSDSTSEACSTYVTALRAYNERCSSSSSLSASRWVELEARYKLACDRNLSLPGTGVNDLFINKCAEATKTAACGGSIPECTTPPGKLADGTACSASDQCLSTYCDTTTSTTGCGTCGKTIALGGACTGTGTDRCVRGSNCVGGTCTAPTYGAVGAACDSTKALYCANGLTCDITSKTCKTLPGVGEACPSYVCATGLTCDFTAKTCYAPTKVAAGQPCGGTTKNVCDAGLTCKSNVCAIITWVKPGGDCSAAGTQCEHGSCLTTTTKLCPKLIPDGGACTSGKPEDGVCDDLASCVNGKCLLSGTNRCG